MGETRKYEVLALLVVEYEMSVVTTGVGWGGGYFSVVAASMILSVKNLNEIWWLGIPTLAACVSEAVAFSWLLHLPFSFTLFFSVGELLIDRFFKMVCQPVFFCHIFLTVKYC